MTERDQRIEELEDENAALKEELAQAATEGGIKTFFLASIQGTIGFSVSSEGKRLKPMDSNLYCLGVL